MAKDYLQHRGLRDFARDSEALTKQHYSAMMHSIANANYRAMKGKLFLHLCFVTYLRDILQIITRLEQVGPFLLWQQSVKGDSKARIVIA